MTRRRTDPSSVIAKRRDLSYTREIWPKLTDAQHPKTTCVLPPLARLHACAAAKAYLPESHTERLPDALHDRRSGIR